MCHLNSNYIQLIFTKIYINEGFQIRSSIIYIFLHFTYYFSLINYFKLIPNEQDNSLLLLPNYLTNVIVFFLSIVSWMKKRFPIDP